MCWGEAERLSVEPAVIVRREVQAYGKDVSQIAIGVARWAEKMDAAIREASTFSELKQLLGY